MSRTRTTCPRCGRRLVTKRDGIFQWKACPASKACGWTVFVHGQDARDKTDERDERRELVAKLQRFNPFGGYCESVCQHPGHSTESYRKTVARIEGTT